MVRFIVVTILAYHVHTTDSANDSHATRTLIASDDNQTQHVTLTETAVADASSQRLGNAISGSFSLTETTSSSVVEIRQQTNQTQTIGFTQSALDTTSLFRTGNAITGEYSLAEVDGTVAGSLVQADDNQMLAQGSTRTFADASTLYRSGNDVVGNYAFTESGGGSSTLRQVGTNSIREFSMTETADSGFSIFAQGNDVTGDASFSEDAVSGSTLIKSDLYLGSSDGSDQTITSEATTTLVASGNHLTGVMTLLEGVSSSSTVLESGIRDSSYSLSQTTTASVSTQQTLNEITSDYSQTLTELATTTLDYTATAANGSYTLNELSSITLTAALSGNHLSGGYTLTEEETSDSSLTEIGGNDSTSFTLLETSGNEASVVRVGNEITGVFDFGETSSATASLHHEGSNDLGTFTLEHANSTTITAVGWGNDIVGDYSIESEASDFYAWTQTNDGGVTYSLHADGVNVRQRFAVGNEITQDYSVDEVGSDSFTLQQLAATDVSIDAVEAYTLTEQGNQASGLFARAAAGTLTFERWIDTVDDAGTVSYSLEAAGDFLVGSLSLTETGDTRYSLLEAFNNTASGQNGAAPGNVDYSPFGAAFNINETAELPTGGMSSPTGGAAVFARRGSALTNAVGSQVANVDASTGAVGIAEWQTGRELSGAGTIDKYSNYGAELFKKFCFRAGTPVPTPGGHTSIEQLKRGDELWMALDSDPFASVRVGVVEEIYSNHAPILNLKINGRTIGTTAEHPIFAWGRGWVPAAALKPGDRLRSHNGKAAVVEAIEYGHDRVDVYNLRVADGHTYFVGASEWGWSVWAHNVNECTESETTQAQPVDKAAPAENNQGEAGATDQGATPTGDGATQNTEQPVAQPGAGGAPASQSSGNLFRGDNDQQPASGPIGKPIDASLSEAEKAKIAADHVKQKIKADDSIFTSWSTSAKTARDKFAEGSAKDTTKVKQSDIDALEASGQIKTYTPTQVADMMKNSGDPKLARQASAVQQQMERNDEVLIEGVIPASVQRPMK